MRRIHRTLLFLLAAALLTVPVFADFGPKPQLTVRVENPPEELYYMDLLAEGPPSPYAEGSSGGLPEEERAAMDQGLLAALTAAAPEGWHCCVVQDTLIWGDIVSDEDLFQFGYSLPDVCRILMVTKSGETFVSKPFEIQVLQSSATVDWAARTVSTPPLWRGYAVQFLATFLPTLAIEGLLFLLFRLWSKRNALVFLGVNLVTQGALTLWSSLETVRFGTFWTDMIRSDLQSIVRFFDPGGLLRDFFGYWLLPAELVILLAEAALYMWLFRDCSKRKAALYALAANLASFLLGLYLAEPVWKFVVDTML